MLAWADIKRTTLVMADGEAEVEAFKNDEGGWTFTIYLDAEDGRQESFENDFDTFEEGEANIIETYCEAQQADTAETRH